jgi:hypothetical protein
MLPAVNQTRTLTGSTCCSPKRIQDITTQEQSVADASLIDSYKSLVARLGEEKIPFRELENEDTVTVPTRLGDQNSQLHIRWEAVAGVVQFIQLVPFVVPPERRDAVAVLITRINAALPILGFTLNPQNGVAAYRVHAFLGNQAAIAPGLIGALIANAAKTTDAFLPILRKVALQPGT